MKILLGVLAFGSIAVVTLGQQSVQAFSWTETAATIDMGDDRGTSFTTAFFSDDASISGLTSEALFTLVGDYDGGTTANFEVNLKNLSDSNKFQSANIKSLHFNANAGEQTLTQKIRKLNIGLEDSATFTTALNFGESAGSFDSFSLDNLVVRYKGQYENGARFSGHGTGTVPTPALLPGLIGMGVAALRKKNRVRSDSKNSETVAG